MERSNKNERGPWSVVIKTKEDRDHLNVISLAIKPLHVIVSSLGTKAIHVIMSSPDIKALHAIGFSFATKSIHVIASSPIQPSPVTIE